MLHYKYLYCQFNVPLLNKTISFFQKIILTPNIWTVVYCPWICACNIWCLYYSCRSVWGDWPYGEWWRGLGELWAAISQLNMHLQLWCRERLVDTYITVVKVRNQVLVQNYLSHRPVFANVVYIVATSWHIREFHWEPNMWWIFRGD